MNYYKGAPEVRNSACVTLGQLPVEVDKRDEHIVGLLDQWSHLIEDVNGARFPPTNRSAISIALLMPSSAKSEQ